MRLTAPRPNNFILTLLPACLTLLLFFYLWTISHRPPIPEKAKIENPHRWGFPEWYGKGPTPYDLESGLSVQKQRSILLFIDLPYDSPSIPQALSTLEILRNDPSIQLSVISPFSSKWDHQSTARRNLELAGCQSVDRLWRIGGYSGEVEGCEGVVWISEGMDRGAGVDGRADVMLTQQPFDMLRDEVSHERLKESQGEDWELGWFSYIPPAANPSIFYPEKTPSYKSITYFPRPSTPEHKHPRMPWTGHWSKYTPSRKRPPPTKAEHDPLAPDSAYIKYWRKEDKLRAKAMRKAGICLFEGWQDGQLDDRMVEAMMAGCVVATVPPQADYDMLKPLILPLSPPPSSSSSPPSLPVKQLSTLLASPRAPEKLTYKALHAFLAARRHFTVQARFERVWNVVKGWENGKRGYDFDEGLKGFRWDCKTVMDGDAGRPAWCQV
ncbi:hypothetical protein I315_01053 [Cryptococcus gattii Ru294]|nr:hypothetical protein I315_01053 [Cryptococcus gattii Ru294]